MKSKHRILGCRFLFEEGSDVRVFTVTEKKEKQR